LKARENDITNLTIWDIARLAGFSEPTIAAAQAEEKEE